MPTAEEKMQILKMIESGQITAEQGADLLAALEQADDKAKTKGKAGKAQWFRVRVTDLKTGKRKVNVNIPMGLVSVGVRMGAKFAPDVEGLDLAQILQAVQDGALGKIVEVEDTEDGEHVEIFVE